MVILLQLTHNFTHTLLLDGPRFESHGIKKLFLRCDHVVEVFVRVEIKRSLNPRYAVQWTHAIVTIPVLYVIKLDGVGFGRFGTRGLLWTDTGANLLVFGVVALILMANGLRLRPVSDSLGEWRTMVSPAVRDKNSGAGSIHLKAQSCELQLDCRWGTATAPN